MNKLQDNKLGMDVKRWREKRGLTQRDLAEDTGLSLFTICRIETGRTKCPTLGTATKLSAALGIRVTRLLASVC